MFGEKNFGKSVDDGVRDRGGMCCKAFLGDRQDTVRQLLRTAGEKNKTYIQAKEAVHECLLLCGEKYGLSQCGVRLH